MGKDPSSRDLGRTKLLATERTSICNEWSIEEESIVQGVEVDSF
jgi:hypothetical protein